MLEVAFEFVSLDGLRAEARRLGIATDGKDREQLVDAIQEKVAESKRQQKRLSLPLVLSIVSIVVASLAAIANWWEASATVGLFKAELAKTNLQTERARTEEWQKLVVYSIVEKGFTANKYESGVSFDQIKSEFLDEAETVIEIELPKEDIQPTALKKVLMCLIRDRMVYQTHDGKYAVNRSELLPGFGRLMQQERAGYDILFVLATESGKYDDQKLQTRIIDKFQLTPQEYRYLITELMKDGYVVRDEDGLLYAASKPPPTD